jgi:tetratricopeptide (TPR) repeat protein
LLIAFGRILMATKGPNDPEAELTFQRAAAVGRKLGNPEMLARALYSLGVIAETRADLDAAEAIGEELRALAESNGDAGIAIAARVRLGVVAYYRGHFVAAHGHLAEALALHATGNYELRDSAIASDPHVAAAYLSVALAHLGHVEQAISHGESAVAGARKSGSSSPAYALALSVWSRTLEVLRDEAQCDECARMLVALAEEQGLSFLLAVGQCQLGWIIGRQGEIDNGLRLLAQAITVLNTLGRSVRLQVGKYLLTDILALSGRRDEALALLDDVLEFSGKTGARWLDAELHRRKGELILASENSDTEQAEQAFRQAIDIGREQSARLFELRAATSLARLLLARGKPATARQLLQPLLTWFSEAADLPDVREASALLAELEVGLPPTDQFPG